MTVLESQLQTLYRLQPMRITGRVSALRGLTVLVEDFPVPVGALVSVRPAGRTARYSDGSDGGDACTWGEVVGFTREHAIVMLLGHTSGIRTGDRVRAEQVAQTAPVGEGLLGRIIDGLGRPIDGNGPIRETMPRPLHPEPVRALQRRRIDEAMQTGVRVVDLMTTVGRGQRLGIFAGPGVGKSTLLGNIARHCAADANVIALVGERGREVGDFLEQALGAAGLARSIVVVATGDESPLLRIRAALLACAAAEYLRDQGKDVMLMMDSVTRYAHALRQVGLSVGEPPATKGYTPSVFAGLAVLLERAGAVAGGGSITGLYTILVEGDDLTEPVSDAARGILDGHVILSRKLAQRAHFPAVDVLDSVSRVADDVVDPTHAESRRQIMRMLAVYAQVEDLVQIGAYAHGSNPEADIAIEYRPRILELLRQGREEAYNFEEARSVLVKIAMESGDALFRRMQAGAKGGAPAPRGP